MVPVRSAWQEVIVGFFGFGKKKPGRQQSPIEREYDGEIHLPPAPSVPPREKCVHGGEQQPFTVHVRGHAVAVKDAEYCRACLTQYFEDFSTTCASCGMPILPWTPVGQAWVGAPHPFTHLTRECCDSGGHYCGRWGEGRLITPHDLDTQQFPKGARSQTSHVMHTGGVFIETAR